MKKWFTGGMALFLAAAMMLTACGKEEAPAKEAASAEKGKLSGLSAEASAPENKPDTRVYDDSLIDSLYDESGSCILDGMEYSYCYGVPQLKDDTPDAKAINQEIAGNEGRRAKESLEAIKAGDYPSVADLQWKSYWNDSVLSLVLEEELPYQGIGHRVYNYDFRTGKRLTEEEVIKRAGYTEETFKLALNRAVLALYDRNFTDVPNRAACISQSNTAETRVYLREQGQLGAFHGMMGWNYYVAVLELEKPAEQTPLSAELDFIRGGMDASGAITLQFTKTPEAEALLGDHIQYDTPYPVEGLYGPYDRMELCLLGEDEQPYLLLMNQDKELSACNIMGCANAGNRFFGMKILPGPYQFLSLDEERRDAQIQNPVGSIDSLVRLLDASETEYYTGIGYALSWIDDSCQALFDGMGAFRLRQGDSRQNGRYFLAGMTEEGLQYGFTLYGEGTATAGGLVTMPCSLYTPSEEEYAISLTVLFNEGVTGLPETGRTLALKAGKPADATAMDWERAGDLCGQWSIADYNFCYPEFKKEQGGLIYTSLNLEPDTSAILQVTDENGNSISRYEGRWFQTGKDTMRLTLNHASGYKRVLDGKPEDVFSGVYQYEEGFDRIMILTPEAGASPLTAAQAEKAGLPEAVFPPSDTCEYDTSNDREPVRRIKNALLNYAEDQFPGSSCMVSRMDADGDEIYCLYAEKNGIYNTDQWYRINPDDLTGQNMLTGEGVDLRGYQDREEEDRIQNAALAFYQNTAGDSRRADFARIAGRDKAGLIVEVSTSGAGFQQTLAYYVIDGQTGLGHLWDSDEVLDFNPYLS